MSRRATIDPTGRYRQPKGCGPNGRRLCRWCHGEVPIGRRTFCGPTCVEEFRLEGDWPYIVRLVEKRDAGICQLCGCDTRKIERVLAYCRYGYDSGSRHYRVTLGFNREQALYQVDHIQPRIEGGTNELTNLRLLCVPCHKHETAALAARRAKERKAAKHKAAALFEEAVA